MCVELELILYKTDTFYEMLKMVVSVFRSLYLSFALKYLVICASFIAILTLASALQLYPAPAKSILLLRVMDCEGLQEIPSSYIAQLSNRHEVLYRMKAYC